MWSISLCGRRQHEAIVLLWLGILSSSVVGIQTSGPSCSVHTTGGGLIRSQCPQGPVTTLEQAKEKAWMFAPVVKFHPLEKYYMETMPVWYNMSRLESQNDLQLEYRTVFDGNNAGVLSGAPFDDSGASSANVYYTLQEYDKDFWLYNFDLFFPWNGCSNQEFVLGSDYLKYLMCPAGVHETDTERLSVLVCKTDLNAIKKVGYNQHAWSEVRDCDSDPESCPLDPTTGNPVVYTALESHALYPENNGFHVYFNLGPLFVGDRTGDDSTKYFRPTKENVKYIPPLDSLPNSAEWDWARFNGNWGKLVEPVAVTLQCLSEDVTSYNDCPNSSAKSLIISVAGAQELAKPSTEQFMFGPLFRPANYQIKGTELSPIVESGLKELKCPEDLVQLGNTPEQEKTTTSTPPVSDGSQDAQFTPEVIEPVASPGEGSQLAPPTPSILAVPPPISKIDNVESKPQPSGALQRNIFSVGILLLAVHAF